MSHSFCSNIFESISKQQEALHTKDNGNAPRNQETSSLPVHGSTSATTANDAYNSIGRRDLLNFLNKPDVSTDKDCSLADKIQLHVCPYSHQKQSTTYQVALVSSKYSDFSSGSKPSESENSGASMLASSLTTAMLQSIQNQDHLNSIEGQSSDPQSVCAPEPVAVISSSTLSTIEVSAPSPSTLSSNASLPAAQIFTAATASGTMVMSSHMTAILETSADAESLQASSSVAVSEADRRKVVKPQELRRLSDSDGYCAFVNIPEKRERRKALALCSRLQKEELRKQPTEHTCFQAPLRQLRASLSQLSGRGRILKYKKNRISALRRQCKKQQTAFKKTVRSSTLAMQQPAFQRYKSALCSLDPIVAASFDQDGTPTVDHVGRSSLHIAMGSFHKPTLRFTVEFFRAENILSCRDNSNCTPLHIACCVGNYEAAEMLLQAGVSPNEFGGDSGSTPLHMAVSKAHLALVKLLVEFGADMTAKDKAGQTILEIQTSPEVQNYIQCTLDAHKCASIVCEANAPKPMICERKLPTIFVLQSSTSSDLRPYVLLSELCDSMNQSEVCFKQRYDQFSLNFLTMDNATIASRIINPFLRDSFERTVSLSENSILVEVDLTVRGLFDTISKNASCHAVSQTIPETFDDDNSYDTEVMFDDSVSREDEAQIQIDDMQESNRSLQNCELLADAKGCDQSHKLAVGRLQEQSLLVLEHSLIDEPLNRAFHTKPNVLKPLLADPSCKEVKEKFDIKDLNHRVLPAHRIETCDQLVRRLPEVDLDLDIDLDTSEEMRVTPKVVQGSRRKSHPLLSSRCTMAKAALPSQCSHQAHTALCSSKLDPNLVSAPSIITVVSDSQHKLFMPNTSFWETSPDSSVLTVQNAEVSASRGNDDPAAAFAHQERIPPMLSVPSSSIQSGRGRTAKMAQKPIEKTPLRVGFNLDSHPGDIYAVTRVKPCFAFAMLEACKIAKK